jgi:hypothetical protein
MVTRILLQGSGDGAEHAKKTLQGQQVGAVSWSDTGGTPRATGPGSSPTGISQSVQVDVRHEGGFWSGVGDFFGQVGGFFKGFGEQAWDDAKALAGLVPTIWYLSPIGQLVDPEGAARERAKWAILAVTVWNNPGAVWDSLTKPFVDPWNRGDYGEAIGRGTFEVAAAVVLAVTTGGVGDGALAVDGTAQAINAADKTAEVANALDKTAEAANVLDKTAATAKTAANVERLLAELEKAGVAPELLKGLTESELKAAQQAVAEWGVNAAGKNQAVIHILDYAEGAGGLGKENRLVKLTEYTNYGPFDPRSPSVLSDVTKTLNELTAQAAKMSAEGAETVATVGNKTISFVPKGGAVPPFSQSQKGIIIIQQDGKYSTFFNGDWKKFNKLD